MALPPYAQAVNPLTQTILTFGSWGIALVLLAVAAVRGARQGSTFPVVVLLASAVAALAEPLYDIAFKLLFFIPGQWTLYRYGDIPQPVWTISGYMILYGGPAIFICEHLARGISRRAFLTWAAATLVISSVFEIYGIAGGTYAYWGPHALRILGYPLVVGVLETLFVMLFSVLAYEYRNRIPRGPGLLGIFVLFPIAFYGVNFGIGAPTLVTIGLTAPSPSLVLGASLVSIGLAVLLLLLLARYVASPSSARVQIAPHPTYPPTPRRRPRVSSPA
jgi:hypothetical protein